MTLCQRCRGQGYILVGQRLAPGAPPGTMKVKCRECNREGTVVDHEPVPSDTASALAFECPLHILAVLHERGHYRHYASPWVPGRVLCVHVADLEGDFPQQLVPTEAQQALDEACKGNLPSIGGK